MSQQLMIEIWSDLICPWCWIGKRRLEKALADFPQRDQVQLVHRAFRLMPGVAPQKVKTLLAQRYGSAEQVEAMMSHIEGEGAREGLEYHLAEGFGGDTLNLHQLVKHAASQGLQDQAIERFYRASFTECLPVFEPSVQLTLMAEIGLDRDVCLNILQQQNYAAAVAEDHQLLQQYHSSGVPFFVINGRQTLSGAQPAEVFAAALNQALPDSVTSQLCGPDGCALP